VVSSLTFFLLGDKRLISAILGGFPAQKTITFFDRPGNHHPIRLLEFFDAGSFSDFWVSGLARFSALSVKNLSQKTRKLFDKDGERHTTWFLDVFGAGSFSDFGLRGRPALEFYNDSGRWTMAKRGTGKRHLLEKRLVTYSVAAGAALAVAGPADANVIYSGAKNITVGTGNSPVNVDINGDVVNDFNFSYYLSSWTSSSLFFESKGIWLAGSQTGNSAIGGNAHVVSFFTFAPYRLPQGDDVSAGMAGAWTSSAGILNGIKYIGGFPSSTAAVSGASQIAMGAGITGPMGNFIGNWGFIGVRFQVTVHGCRASSSSSIVFGPD